ncbi:hypothetical protein ACJX0J_021277, partial [Zea mays]
TKCVVIFVGVFCVNVIILYNLNSNLVEQMADQISSDSGNKELQSSDSGKSARQATHEEATIGFFWSEKKTKSLMQEKP